MKTNTALFVIAFSSLASSAFAENKVAPVAPAKISIEVNKKGFSPANLTVKKGVETRLSFTRVTDSTCAKEVIIDLGNGSKIAKDLPLNKTVEVVATFAKSGSLSYACKMDMIGGVITVQ